ncbi:unnamed protein product, partial [Ectocarpus sp. 8 AP-2014]
MPCSAARRPLLLSWPWGEESLAGRLAQPERSVMMHHHKPFSRTARRREAMGAWTKERRGRDLCERCRRTREMCLCSSLPAEAMPTSTRFVILQHPAETKKRVTGTVPLVLHCLANCTRVVMRHDYSEQDLRKALGVEGAIDRSPERVSEISSERENSASTGTPLLLFPCPGAEYLE